MARKTFRFTPGDLRKRLDENRFAFLSHDVREKIDELMALVTFDHAAHESFRNAEMRWYALPRAAQEEAGHRLSVCCAVYCLMAEEVMPMLDAIRQVRDADVAQEIERQRAVAGDPLHEARSRQRREPIVEPAVRPRIEIE